MRRNHLFVIDSDSSGHRLALDGEEFGTFTSLNAAESKAGDIARMFCANATPRFELDFAWTLSDAQVRAASLQW
jgi:hypothetical protein